MGFKKDLKFFKKEWETAINLNNPVYYNYILELCKNFIHTYPRRKQYFEFELKSFIIILMENRDSELDYTIDFLLNNYKEYLYHTFYLMN